MALRSLRESYVLPKSKLDEFNYEDSARKLREAMEGLGVRTIS